jgi:hypothetical protein
MIKVRVFKKRRRKEETRKTTNLVTNEKFQVWWPLEGISCLKINGEDYQFGNQWEISNFVAPGLFHVTWPLDYFMVGGF